MIKVNSILGLRISRAIGGIKMTSKKVDGKRVERVFEGSDGKCRLIWIWIEECGNFCNKTVFSQKYLINESN